MCSDERKSFEQKVRILQQVLLWRIHPIIKKLSESEEFSFGGSLEEILALGLRHHY